MDRHEMAVVSLVRDGKVDVGVWREVAAASPSTFYEWANHFTALQIPELLERCFRDLSFREAYKGDWSYIIDNIESVGEFCRKDIKVLAESGYTTPFGRPAADNLVNWASECSYCFSQYSDLVIRLVSRYPDLQAKCLGLTHSPPIGPSVDLSVLEQYLQKENFNGKFASWVIRCYTPEQLKSLRLKQFADPAMALMFGSSGLAERLHKTEYRSLGYLSLLNVRNDDWTDSFQKWLTRHGKYHKTLIQSFKDVELVRDLGNLDDEFFTENRLLVFDGLLSRLKGVKLRMPPMLSIRFKELFLVGEKAYPHIQKAVIDGRKAFSTE